jgi:hypothetical protein
VRTGRVRPYPIQRGHGAMRAMSPTRARRVLCELPFQGVARVRIALGAILRRLITPKALSPRRRT